MLFDNKIRVQKAHANENLFERLDKKALFV